MPRREKGDFSIKNIDGVRRWFSDWLTAVDAELTRTAADRSGLTHWILEDGFRKGERPEFFVARLIRSTAEEADRERQP